MAKMRSGKKSLKCSSKSVPWSVGVTGRFSGEREGGQSWSKECLYGNLLVL